MKLTWQQRLRTLTAVDAVGLSLVVVMGLGFVFGVLGPIALRQQRAATLRQAALRQQQHARATAASSAALAKRLQQADIEIAALPIHVLPPASLNERLAALLKEAAGCGLTVSDLKPGQALHGGRFVATPVTMTCRGGYVSAASFLHAVHAKFPDIGVCGFRLEQLPGRAAANFTIDLHWLADPSATSQVVAADLTE